MITGKTLLGRSIVGQNDGKIIGHVRDLIFDNENNEILALVVADKDLFGLIDALIVPWRLVKNFNGDAIMVESSASLMKLHQDPRTYAVTQNPTSHESVLSGTKVLSSTGEVLGTLADMCIDENSGHVLGYAVSKGFISDTLRGKKFVPAPPGLSLGRDAAIATPTTEAQIKGEIPTNVALPDITAVPGNTVVSTNPPISNVSTNSVSTNPVSRTGNANLPLDQTV